MNRHMKIIRIGAGMTQHALGKAVGLTENKICRIETGRWVPPGDIRIRIERALGAGDGGIWPREGEDAK